MHIPIECFTDPDTRVVYSITAGEWCAYVGDCPFSKFAKLIDARRQPKLIELFQHDEALKAGLKVTILGIVKGEERAFNLRETFRVGLRPRYDWLHESAVVKERRKRETRPVRCIETGEEYESAAECARELGISPSNLSNHLNKVLKRVGGYTFEYC